MHSQGSVQESGSQATGNKDLFVENTYKDSMLAQSCILNYLCTVLFLTKTNTSLSTFHTPRYLYIFMQKSIVV